MHEKNRLYRWRRKGIIRWEERKGKGCMNVKEGVVKEESQIIKTKWAIRIRKEIACLEGEKFK